MLRNIRRNFTKYKSNREGATAIEFAILAIPFMTILFSIIELAIVFFISSTLTHAMNEAARDVRTGEFQAKCGGAEQFKKAVCNNMATLGDCANLRIDVVTSDTGRFVPGLLEPTPGMIDPDTGKPYPTPQVNPDVYDQSGARDVVVARAQYYHQLSLPGKWTRLSNQPSNKRVLTAATAFRNEPFPDTGCAS